RAVGHRWARPPGPRPRLRRLGAGARRGRRAGRHAPGDPRHRRRPARRAADPLRLLHGPAAAAAPPRGGRALVSVAPAPRAAGATYRLGLVIEQSLGHLTHHRNLEAFLERDPSVEPVWVPIPYTADDAWERLPLVRSNWSLRGGLRSLAAVRACLRAGPVDALLFHTQITALCAV